MIKTGQQGRGLTQLDINGPALYRSYSAMVRGSNNCQLSEAIQNLPPELREVIYKEYITIKMKQQADLGWDEVHEALGNTPFCEELARIAKVTQHLFFVFG